MARAILRVMLDGDPTSVAAVGVAAVGLPTGFQRKEYVLTALGREPVIFGC